MFSKRHYQAIALAMQNSYPCQGSDPTYDAGCFGQWKFTCNHFADAFERDNGLFKRDLFLRACQPGANVRKRT